MKSPDEADADSEAEVAPPSVDLTLIDEMLRMSPRQRLEQNDRAAALALKLRAAFTARTNGCETRET